MIKTIIIAAAAIVLWTLPVNAGGFVGIQTLRDLKCPYMRKITPKTNIEMAQTTDDGYIEINPNDFAKLQPETQKYIYMHECGHASGRETELGADTWAWKHYMRERITTKLLDEICDDLTDLAGYYEGTNRCTNLLGLAETRMIGPPVTSKKHKPK